MVRVMINLIYILSYVTVLFGIFSEPKTGPVVNINCTKRTFVVYCNILWMWLSYKP